MKKALSLFMTITATTYLFSMEQPVTYALNQLPQDVQNTIIECLNQDKSHICTINAILATSCTCSSLHETIYMLYGIGHVPLIKASATHDAHKKFHKLVHALANKFNVATGEIAKEVKAPIFQHYFDLLVELHNLITRVDIDIKNRVKELIEEGVDINGSGHGRIPPLMNAIPLRNIDLITLLLDSGANPNATGATGLTMEDCLGVAFDLKKREQIKQLLEDARKKIQGSEKKSDF